MKDDVIERMVDETASIIRDYATSHGFGSAEGIARGLILRYEAYRSGRSMTEVQKEWDS